MHKRQPEEKEDARLHVPCCARRLVENFQIAPISTPENDLKQMLG